MVSDPNFCLNVIRGKVNELLFAYPSGLKLSQFQDAYGKRFGQFIDLDQVRCDSVVELLHSMKDLVNIQPLPGTNDALLLSRSERVRIAACLTNGSGDESNEAGSDDDCFADCVTIHISKQLKADIRKVLAAHPSGLKIEKLSPEFERLVGKELPLKSLGFTSVLEFVEAVPHIIRSDKHPNNLILFDVNSSIQLPASNEHGNNQASSCKSCSECKELIYQIVAAKADGLLLSDLPSEFQTHTGMYLDASLFGYTTLTELIVSMADAIKMVYKHSGCIMLYAKSRPESLAQSVTAQRPSQLHLNFGIEMDSVVPGEQYKMQPIPELNGSNGYFPIRVSHSYNPGNFWIQLNSEHEALEKLMNEIQEYNCRAMDIYSIPEDLLVVGLLCAGRYFEPTQDDWHRCVVTGFKEPLVEVFYVDYGTTSSISPKNMRLLRRQFLSLPAQALRARLANRAPPEAEWSIAAANSFLSLVAQRVLVAQLVDVITDSQLGQSVLSLVLCDTNGEDDVYTGDVLVHRNLAVIVDDSQLKAQRVAAMDPAVCAAMDPAMRAAVDAAACAAEHVSCSARSYSNAAVQIQFLQLTADYSFHLLTINKKQYVACTEISALLWTEDILRSELRQRGCTNLGKLVLVMESHKDIIETLARVPVAGTVVDGRPKELIVLFELASVLQILEMFKHPSAELKNAISSLLNSASGGIEDSRLDELQSRWKALDTHRMSILEQIQASRSATLTRRHVKSMQDVEEQMQQIRQQIQTFSSQSSSVTSASESANFKSQVAAAFNDCGRPLPNQKGDGSLLLPRGRGRGRPTKNTGNVAAIVGQQRAGKLSSTSCNLAPLSINTDTTSVRNSNSGAAGLLFTENAAAGNSATAMMPGNSDANVFAVCMASNAADMTNLLSQLTLASARVQNHHMLNGSSIMPQSAASPLLTMDQLTARPLNISGFNPSCLNAGALAGGSVNPSLLSSSMLLNPGLLNASTQLNAASLLLDPSHNVLSAANSSFAPSYTGSMLSLDTLNWLAQQHNTSGADYH